MPDIPAFCDKCGAIFRSGIFIGGGGVATLVGNKAGPCPSCGSMGTIPDGVFSAAGNVLRLLSGPSKTVNQLKQLASVISEAQRTQEEPNIVADKIKEEAPELASVIDALPQTRAELYSFILVIFTAITMLIAVSNLNNNETLSEAEIEKMVEESIEKSIGESQKKSSIPENKPPYKAPKKQGRNELCNCGSGKKFKRCCGMLS